MANEQVAIGIGLVQLRAKLYKATVDEGSSLRSKVKSLCVCGTAPKQRIVCPACDAEYTSYAKVPQRGFEYAKGQFVTLPTEEWESAGKVESSKALGVEKVVDFKTLATRFVLSDPHYLVPDNDGLPVDLKLFRLLVEALDTEGWALLARAALRGYPKRVALIADAKENVLMAYIIEDRRPVPYAATPAPVTDIERGQLRQLLGASKTDDLAFEAEKDGKLALIESKLDAMLNAGLGVEVSP